MRRIAITVAMVLALAVVLCAQHGAPAAEPGHSQAAQEGVKAGEGTPVGEHGSEHEGDPDFWWKIVNFAVLVGALGYFIGKKAGPFFKARTDEIRKGIDEAAAMKADAERRAAEVEARLARLDEEIAVLRSEATQEVAAEGERVRSETQAHIAKVRAGAEHEIASAAKAARQGLKEHAAELALALAEKQIEARVTPEVQAFLLDRFISGLKQERVQ